MSFRLEKAGDGRHRIVFDVNHGEVNTQHQVVSALSVDAESLNAAIFSALCRDVFGVSATFTEPKTKVLPEEEGVVVSPKSGGRWLLASKHPRLLRALVSVLAVGLIVWGIWDARSGGDETVASVGSVQDELAKTQAEVNAEIRRRAGGGEVGALGGQGATAQTLRALGLDPGKADTGCLLGVPSR